MIIEHSDLTTKVYRWLRDQILHHVFLPGDKLDVQQLADDLGVSRTPVKDAINRLTAEGLVVLRSRRGTYVARLTAAALHDLFDTRLMVETWAVQHLTPEQMAAVVPTIHDLFARGDRIITTGDAAHFDYPAFYALDTTLHETLVWLPGNTILVDLHRIVIARAGVGRIYFPGDEEIWTRSLAAHEEHRTITAAVTAGDVTALLDAVRAHIRASHAHTTMLLDRFTGAERFRELTGAADG